MPVGVLGLVNAFWNWLLNTLPPVWTTMLKIFATMFLGREGEGEGEGEGDGWWRPLFHPLSVHATTTTHA